MFFSSWSELYQTIDVVFFNTDLPKTIQDVLIFLFFKGFSFSPTANVDFFKFSSNWYIYVLE